MPPRRYLLLMLGTVTIAVALAWAWALALPMAYMEPEYAAFRAKQVLLDRCDLGQAMVLGDSRAAADIVPARLPFPVTNLAIGGGEPIEATVLLRRALRCPNPPKRVFVSFDAGHFSRPDLFWERSVRFGLLTAADIAELRAVSAATHDWSVYRERDRGPLPLRLRDWLRLAHFPTYDFASLLHAGLFLREPRNEAMFVKTLRARGQYSFGDADGSSVITIEGHLRDFHPLPVLDHYFTAMVALLDARGIDTVFLPMPVNDTTFRQIRPALTRGFTAYLTGLARRYPHFHLAGPVIQHRPDAMFGDEFCHMRPSAAVRFSDELAQRLQAAPPRTQNEAQNGWFSATGRAASASVAPNSKRGS